MPLKRIDLSQPLEPLRWQLGGLLLKGFLNTVASLPGEGKTAVLTALAWQASRPEGGYLAGRRVAPNVSIYVDFDAPGEGRSFRYWLDKHRLAYPDGDMNRVILLEPDLDTFGLNEEDLKVLTDMARESKAELIIIDSFMAAFPQTDPSKLTQVQVPLWYLRRLATELGACVVLVDHLPKPMNGELAGARGVMGSVAKPAQSRSVHLLMRVPPKEVEGRHILKWETIKLSYAALPEPFGLEYHFDDGKVSFEACALPNGFSDTRTGKASRAMQDHLEAHRGLTVSRQDLLRTGIEAGNLKERAAKQALKMMVEVLGEELVVVELPGRGQPLGYQLLTEADLEDSLSHCPSARNEEKLLQEGQAFGVHPSAPKDDTALNNNPYDRLRQALEQSHLQDDPNASTLRATYRQADEGDEQARTALEVYLTDIEVLRALRVDEQAGDS